MKQYGRKEFMKLATLGGLAMYVNACNNGNSTKVPPKVSNDTIPLKLPAEPTIALYKKGDAEYEQLRHGFNKRFNKFPSAIALCKTTDDVVQAVKYAIDNKLPVAVKSGGHSIEGFSVNDGGLVINLSEMKDIQWLDDSTVKVGPGNTLAHLYDELLPKGKFIPGGSCASVGIGGLTLGGGYGMFSREYGLTCDSLLQVTMVDGKGNVLDSKNDAGLLWACRGGGSGNFGVVTEMVFKVHNVPASMQSFWFKTPKTDAANAVSILQQWFSVTTQLPNTCFSGIVLNGKTFNVWMVNFGEYTPGIKLAVDTFSGLLEKASIGKPKPMAQAVKGYYGSSVPVYFRNSCAGLYKSFDDLKPFIHDVFDKVMQTPGMIYALNTLGGKVDTAAFESGSCFPHRACHYLSELQTYWQQPAQEEKLNTAFNEVQSLFTANNIHAQYRNYPWLGFEDSMHAYYGANFEKLQQLKLKYDAANVFNHAQSIPLPKG